MWIRSSEFSISFTIYRLPYAVKDGQRPYSIINMAMYFKKQIGKRKTIIIFDSTEEEDATLFTDTFREEGTRIYVGSRFEVMHLSQSPNPAPPTLALDEFEWYYCTIRDLSRSSERSGITMYESLHIS